jgi:protein-S-isoprenylcysteine O-methyltransferase Ste14
VLVTFGNFLFRWRNAIFPLTIAALVVLSPPEHVRTKLELVLLCTGLAAAAAGQALRIITVGWDYIERGGVQGRVAASRLVTEGMFSRSRNPMYVGNLLVAGGFLLALGHAVPAAAGIAFFVLAYRSIVASEERVLGQKFGSEYAAYCASVPRWLPRLRGLRAEFRTRPLNLTAILVREFGTLSATLVTAMALVAWRLQEHDFSGRLSHLLDAAVIGFIAGFYLTMRTLKKRRIVWVPR